MLSLCTNAINSSALNERLNDVIKGHSSLNLHPTLIRGIKEGYEDPKATWKITNLC